MLLPDAMHSFDDESLMVPALIGTLVFHASIIATVWGRGWVVGGLLVCLAGRVTLATVGRRAFDGLGPRGAGVARWVAGLALDLLVCRLGGWSLAVLFYLGFLMTMRGAVDEEHERRRMAPTLAACLALAWWDDVAVGALALAAIASCVLFLVAEGRTATLRRLLGRLDVEREELGRARAELTSAREQLAKREKLVSLGMLAGGVAAEVEKPMCLIANRVGALARDLPKLPTERLREYLAEMLPPTLDEIARVEALAGDLERFAREEQGEIVEYSLNDEVQSALRICDGMLRRAGGRLEVSLGALPPLHGCPRELAQVVVQLVLCAAQAIPEGGHVTVRTAFDGDALVVISDDGDGAPAGGLGVWAARDLLAAHGGTIVVDAASGRGTTFILRLPRVPPSLRQAA